MGLINSYYNRLVRNPIEQDTLSRANLFHAKASFACKCLFRNFILARTWLFLFDHELSGLGTCTQMRQYDYDHSSKALSNASGVSE